MKKLLIALLLATTLLGTSCIGSYRAMRGLTTWNTKATDSKWWNEVIHLGLYIVPVYELLWFGDILIFNSIEFWTGSNPLSEPDKPLEGAEKK